VIGFVAAVQFLTRVPIRLSRPPDPARSVPWFPVVGALVGAAAGAVVVVLFDVTGPAVAAACAVVVGLVVTGAFHEDGLADVADAFGGGWTVEERLRILQDPRHGTYGVAALGASIALRAACVASMPGSAPAFAALVAAHALARGAAVGAMVATAPAASSGLGAEHARSVGRTGAATGVAAAVAIAVLATGWWAVPLAAAAAVAGVTMTWLARRKIGGLTGDVLGAIEQVAECLVLVIAVALAREHVLWWR
jgi:adenosylcobinamide-GDP ribazoletransferase